jgi:hypothetical protein
MKMAAAFIEAFGIGIGIGVAIAIGSRLFRITIVNPDTDSDTDSECYGLSLFSEQSGMRSCAEGGVYAHEKMDRAFNPYSFFIFTFPGTLPYGDEMPVKLPATNTLQKSSLLQKTP